MKLTILQAPYDSGCYGVRMGQGPLRLVEQGLLARLEKAGHDVEMDLDVLDPDELKANDYAAPGGLTVAEMVDVIRVTARHLRIAGAGLTAYDPDQDPEGRGLGIAERLLTALA